MNLSVGAAALASVMEGDYTTGVDEAVSYLRYQLGVGEVSPAVVNGIAFQMLDSAHAAGAVAARQLWETLAERDCPDSLANLAIACLQGKGGAQDLEAANRHFERVLAFNDASPSVRLSALSGLADSLLLGRGCETDKRRALKLYEEAAQQHGAPTAAMNAAVCWDDRPGEEAACNLPPPDYDKAAAYYAQASRGGIVHATARLAMLHLHRKHSSADPSEGFRLLRQAAKAGDSAARSALQEIADRALTASLELPAT